MKRIIFFFFCCLLYGWGTIYAHEESYIIEAYGGPVKYQKNGTSIWMEVNRGLVLFSNDYICIEENGYVTIGYQNYPYNFNTPCNAKIYDLVKEKKNKNSKQYSQKSFLKTIGTNKSDTLPFHMKQIGAGRDRGTGKDTINYKALAKTLTWMGALACTKMEIPQINGITFNRIKTDEGALNFEYSNSSGRDYYINVLHVNKYTNKISLCYVITKEVKERACPITPNGYTSCNRGLNFPNTSDDVYILIALDYPYDSEKLNNKLTQLRIDTADKTDIHIKYMW